jgi:hypothetical protein
VFCDFYDFLALKSDASNKHLETVVPEPDPYQNVTDPQHRLSEHAFLKKECGFTLVNIKTLKLDLVLEKLSLFFRVPDI